MLNTFAIELNSNHQNPRQMPRPLALLASAAAIAFAQPSWRNTSLPFSERAELLIAALNLTEKVALLSASAPAIDRIGLPAYNWASECERGDSSGRTGTAFPSGIALGSTFNDTLVNAVAFATAVEVRANNDVYGSGASCFGPVTNFIRDPRWGRTNEMLGGEDTTLASRLGVAFTRGIQRGSVPDSKYRMVNTIAKHLSAYSGPEGFCGGVSFGTQASVWVCMRHVWRALFYRGPGRRPRCCRRAFPSRPRWTSGRGASSSCRRGAPWLWRPTSRASCRRTRRGGEGGSFTSLRDVHLNNDLL